MKCAPWIVCCSLSVWLAASAGTAQDTASSDSGGVLILSNDRAIEGGITKEGANYRVRRGGGETVIPGERVKRLCRDWQDALAYVRAQANLGDPDERLRLARWCQLHDLREAAAQEARAAVEMRPGHAESKRLLEVLARAVTPVAAGNGPAPSAAAKAAAMPLDLSADTLASFAGKVQPVLMNTCAACHARGEGGGFELVRAAADGPRSATQQNLAAVLEQLNLERPAASPLLVKAVSAHGQAAQPPLRDRRTAPFVTMQQWVEQVAANNPHLRGPRAAEPSQDKGPATLAVAPAAAPSPGSKTGEVISRPVPRSEISERPPTPAKAPLPPPTLPAAASPGQLVPAATSADPFDPALFNRKK